MYTLKEILTVAVQIEQTGHQTYQDAAQRCSDRELAKLLQKMADEEAKHETYFSQLQSTFGDGTATPLLDKMARSFLREMVSDQQFSLQEADLAALPDVAELIRISIDFERDTILFYELIRTLTEDPDAVAVLDQILTEEERHVEQMTAWQETTLSKTG